MIQSSARSGFQEPDDDLMEMPTSGYVRCALCGADNPVAERACHACHGQLPASRRIWNQPAFERVLLASFLASTKVSSGQESEAKYRGLRSTWSWLRASGETISAVLLNPDRAFRLFRLEGGFAPPAAFVTAIGSAALFLHLLVAPRFDVATDARRWWQVPIIVLAPVVYVYLRAQVVHLVLVLGGHAKEAFEVTFRVVAYGSASAAVLLLVPVAGEFLFLATGVWIESTGLRRCHSISLNAALVAEVTPAAVLVLTVLAAVTTRVLW